MPDIENGFATSEASAVRTWFRRLNMWNSPPQQMSLDGKVSHDHDVIIYPL